MMKKFITNVLMCVLCVGLAYCVVYVIYLNVIVEKPTDNTSLYIFGDSQTYQGLILYDVEKALHTKCLSSAEHGNGVYDFLVFVENIPNNSKCIIGMSEALLYRNISSDNNHSGLNYNALCSLFLSGYSCKELCHIAQTNHFLPKKNLFSSRHSTYSYADSILYAEPLDGWKNLFVQYNRYHTCKKNAYLCGIQKLIDKGCTIHIITYPLYYEIESFAQNSSNRDSTQVYQTRILNMYNLHYEEKYIASDSLLMHDLSHLNEIGARLTTKCIISHIQKSDCNSFLEIKIEH